MSESTNPSNPSPAVAEEPAHDEHDVHVFEESGLREGHKPVPKWYWGVLIALSIFFVVYIALNLTGVQPNSAR